MKKILLPTLIITLMAILPLTTQAAEGCTINGKTIHTLNEAHRITHVAQLYNLDAELIAAMNNMDPHEVMPAGTKIAIPQEPPQKVAVKKGDTLYSIAKKNNITVKKLMHNNSIKDPQSVKSGQELVLPFAALKNEEDAVAQQGYNETFNTASRGTDKGLAAPDFIWPLQGKISSKFGARRSGFHHGLDIANSLGTEIMAISGGQVIKAGWLSGIYGYGVKIDHGNGYSSLYAHAQELFVSEGDQVEQGEVIAGVGNTGRSTGPHLHLEIRVNDIAKDPLSFLP